MFTNKENALLEAIVKMKNTVEKNKAIIMGELDEDYVILNTEKVAVLIKNGAVMNPIQWIKELSDEFGNTLAGNCEIKDITDIPIDLDKSPSTVYVTKGYQVQDAIDLFNLLSDVEPVVRVFGSQTVVRYNVELLPILDVSGEIVEVETLAYGIQLSEEEEEEFGYYEDDQYEDDFEDEDLDYEDEVVEREDLIISGSSVTLSGTLEDVNKVTFNDTYKDIAHEVASLVSDKQKAYGNSVDKAERIIEILMEQYDNGDGTYTIPKELISHLLYQVRILDKQNRIFTNPKGDLMDESPYTDILGYALLMLAKLKEEN